MSSDIELMRQAAKAAGLPIECWEKGCHAFRLKTWMPGEPSRWNPLTNDGDALRLAVGAGIEIGSVFQYGRALATIGTTRGRGEFWEDGLDPLKATRRAIVRAAAEIGRRMP